jgi:tryptophan synthase alpha chain
VGGAANITECFMLDQSILNLARLYGMSGHKQYEGPDMTRIDAKFAELKAAGKKAFVTYVMAGDPTYDSALEVVKGLPAAGVDIIELGLPFTHSIGWATRARGRNDPRQNFANGPRVSRNR